MKTIVWKYPIYGIGRQIVEMPKGAEVLTAQAQADQICLWALVDKDAPKEEREIEVIGTGWEGGGALHRYIGTVQLEDGNLVWHVFEILSRGTSENYRSLART